ncbi:MAG: hypothetical protein ACERKD_01530 [Prolixibacteraceae bacterium]
MILQTKHHFRKSLILFVLLSILFIQPCRAQETIHTYQTNDNLEQLMATLKKDHQATKIWWNTWLGIYSVGTVVQTGIALQTDNKALKQDMYLGAATTLLGSGAQLFTPMVKIDKSFFVAPETQSQDERTEMMRKAQDLLEKSSAFEKAGRSWKNHALTGVVNVGGGVITWLAFDRTLKDGIINFAINTVVTEVQIWSQPIIAKKALEKYSRQIETEAYSPNTKIAPTFTASAIPSGIQFKLVF